MVQETCLLPTTVFCEMAKFLRKSCLISLSRSLAKLGLLTSRQATKLVATVAAFSMPQESTYYPAGRASLWDESKVPLQNFYRAPAQFTTVVRPNSFTPVAKATRLGN